MRKLSIAIVCTRYRYFGSKCLFRLLAVFLALGAVSQVLLAQEGSNEPNKANDLTGVWTQKLVNPPIDNRWLVTFHKDGTALGDQQGDNVFDPVQSTQQGLWKKIGARTFISSFLQLEYNHDATLYGTANLQGLYTMSPAGDEYDRTIVVTETLANGQVNHFSGQFHAVRLILTPPQL